MREEKTALPDSKLKEKEREARLKVLREELEAQIEADLAQAGISTEVRATAAGTRPTPTETAQEITPKRILEALLFASSRPLTIAEIRKLLAGAGPTAKQIESILHELKEEYHREDRSFELIQIAGGWQIVTRKAYSSWLARLELQNKVRQASHSALETLAILAYKQPVTRAEIEELRGVDVSAVLSTLMERGFIRIVGKKEVAGRPFLYGTTEKFLEHFGLKSISDLPGIGEIKTLVERAVKREELIKEDRGEPCACPNEDQGETQGLPLQEEK